MCLNLMPLDADTYQANAKKNARIALEKCLQNFGVIFLWPRGIGES
jgi:hypothetical protein